MRVANTVLIAALFIGTFVEGGFAQTGSYRLEPVGVEVDLTAGRTATTTFTIKAESLWILRDRLTLSIADWEIDKEGITIYKEPGDSECSASRWISADPAMVSSGDSKLIRVVIRVPENTAPGVYTSAVLVELKRTPWVPDGKGSPTIFEVFTLYVNVRPPGPDRLLSGGN